MSTHHIELADPLRGLEGIEIISHRHHVHDQYSPSAVAATMRPATVCLRLRDLPPPPPAIRL
ncbi:MAG TPA: hypothetical protein VLA19_29650 [Herpetosiphonaceae bacterium]|nr:hypothetical protein [Herpetosiphonaceae bacterium]